MNSLEKTIYESNNLSMIGVLAQRRIQDEIALKKYNRQMKVLESIKDINKPKRNRIKKDLLNDLRMINHRRT